MFLTNTILSGTKKPHIFGHIDASKRNKLISPTVAIAGTKTSGEQEYECYVNPHSEISVENLPGGFNVGDVV